MLERQHARVALRHPAAQPASSTEARRAHSDTGLPWTVAVDSIDVDAQLDQFAGRRGVWMAGLAMLVLLVLSGGYVIARAVTRELAVARLQSRLRVRRVARVSAPRSRRCASSPRS